ncbi:MAG: phosphoglycolate phosphatase [Alphaproteobacteria bacterium]
MGAKPGILKNAGVLFDLDGTLVDSAPDLARVLNILLEREGLPCLREEAVRPMVGRGARKLLARGFEAAGREPAEGRLDDLTADFLSLYSDGIADLSTPFAGVRPVLATLGSAGARLAVCTNKKERLARQLLEELDLLACFGAVLGADSVPARKPDPRHLTTAIAALEADAARTVMVGDSAADVNAARAAGIPVIAVAWGYTETPARNLGADAVVEHFHEIPERVAALLA